MKNALLWNCTKWACLAKKQHVLPVVYNGKKIDNAYRIDLWVEDQVVVEIKATEKILPIHKAQILTYMRLAKSPLGLLMNFNEKLLKDGINRFALSDFAK